jgi:bifunctional non-homologous end joining protein LigD
MGLTTYWAKRDFGLTPEPRGKAGKRASQGWSFVVQKHAASHLHYDFRLELDGVLLSWAVPKGPSLDPADKRLAMQTEDHPIEYGGFEGIIPKGQYGGGTVMVWDRGTWTPQGDPREGLKKGRLKFTLDGAKLSGGWNLVRTRGRDDGKNEGRAWLLIKERDADAVANASIVEQEPDSVASGRSLDEIAQAKEHVWRSDKSVKENVKAGAVATAKRKSAVPDGAKKSALPDYVAPMLTTLMADPPAGDDWIHEVKYDGYRLVARIERGKVRLFSRNEKEWTASFPQVARDLAALPVQSAWIDGEVVVLDESGRSSFQGLQNALANPKAKGVAFFAFDVMYLDGYDLRGVVLTERKRVLREIAADQPGLVRVGPELAGSGDEFFAQACKLGLEGIIAKRATSTYASGLRTREWQKIKCIQRQEMVIAGYTEPQGSRKGFGALLLGYHEDGKLRYAGKVGTGFNDAMLRKLMPELTAREIDKPAFVDPPRGYEAKGAHWIRPELVAEIAFTEWSRDGALRHPSFQGMRPDKKAADVVRERPADKSEPATKAAKAHAAKLPAKSSKSKKAASAKTTAAKTTAAKTTAAKTTAVKTTATARAPARKSDEKLEIAGIAISNPGKPYFPEAHITKGDLVQYYVDVAPLLLPHIAGRPLSLVRCPDGWRGQCFYQKNADKAVNPAVSRIPVPESGGGKATYMGASTPAALAALVQWGVIEMHPWGARAPRLDRPDRLIFDFDPDPDLPWSDLVTAVTLLRTLLGEMNLTGFLKTTGGKGLHVVLPIRATLDWDEAKDFTRSVAELMVRTFPDRFVATITKAKRHGKILIDYFRNAREATAVAPYVVRSRENAPVAMPIAWDELGQDVRNDHFNVGNARERLASLKQDPWADFLDTRQTITAAMRKRLAR